MTLLDEIFKFIGKQSDGLCWLLSFPYRGTGHFIDLDPDILFLQHLMLLLVYWIFFYTIQWLAWNVGTSSLAYVAILMISNMVLQVFFFILYLVHKRCYTCKLCPAFVVLGSSKHFWGPSSMFYLFPICLVDPPLHLEGSSTRYTALGLLTWFPSRCAQESVNNCISDQLSVAWFMVCFGLWCA